MLWPSPSFVLHDDLVQSGIAGFHPPAGLNQAQFHFWAKPELDEMDRERRGGLYDLPFTT